MESVTLKNRSGDQKYFVQIPELVKAMCDPYELSLWMSIKMICGPEGRCDASVPLLAKLAKMSVGKTFNARKNLLKKGLLEGEQINPSNQQSRWTLTVPDIWEENVKVRKAMGDSLHDRANAYEHLQCSTLAEIQAKISLSREEFFSWSEKNFSPHEKPFSQSEKNFSPHEKPFSQSEKNFSPHEKPFSQSEKNFSPHEKPFSQSEKNFSPHEKNEKIAKDITEKDLHSNLVSPSFSPHEIKYNIELEPFKNNKRGKATTPSLQSFWKLLEPVKKWWDESAIPAYSKKYPWGPGDLVTGPLLEELLRQTEKLGIEVLAAKYENFLCNDKKFFAENHHPMSLFVKCLAQFSGNKNGTSNGNHRETMNRQRLKRHLANTD